jgi:hypothetical protein
MLNRENNSAATTSLLLLTVFATIALLPSFGSIDMNIWLFWGENPYLHGLVDGYALNAHEHPPGLSILLWLAFHLAALLGIAPYLGIKLTFLPFLFASSAIVYHWSKRNYLFTIFFHAMLSYSCMALSYIDIYFAPFFLLALYWLQKEKFKMALLSFTAACLLKYPPLIVAPFFLFFCFYFNSQKNTGSLKNIFSCLLPALLLAAAVLLPFGAEPVKALQRAFQHSLLSAQALNLNWIIGRVLLASGDIPVVLQGDQSLQLLNATQIPSAVKILSRLLFGFFYGSALWVFLKREKNIDNLLLAALTGHFAYFMFAIGAHENHLFLSCLLTTALACRNTQYLPLAAGVWLLSSSNLFLFYGIDGHPVELFRGIETDAVTGSPLYAPYPVDIRLLAALFNVAYFLILCACVLRNPGQHSPNTLTP